MKHVTLGELKAGIEKLENELGKLKELARSLEGTGTAHGTPLDQGSSSSSAQVHQSHVSAFPLPETERIVTQARNVKQMPQVISGVLPTRLVPPRSLSPAKVGSRGLNFASPHSPSSLSSLGSGAPESALMPTPLPITVVVPTRRTLAGRKRKATAQVTPAAQAVEPTRRSGRSSVPVIRLNPGEDEEILKSHPALLERKAIQEAKIAKGREEAAACITLKDYGWTHCIQLPDGSYLWSHKRNRYKAEESFVGPYFRTAAEALVYVLANNVPKVADAVPIEQTGSINPFKSEDVMGSCTVKEELVTCVSGRRWL